jgi:hypothetical protein
MKIITGHTERNMAVCATVADRMLHFVTNVFRVATSEMHANFSSQYPKAGDSFENVGVYKREACTGFWWGNMRERDHWGDPGVDGRIILRWIFKK